MNSRLRKVKSRFSTTSTVRALLKSQEVETQIVKYFKNVPNFRYLGLAGTQKISGFTNIVNNLRSPQFEL